MPYDYFYGADGASQYAFFRIPKLLVRREQESFITMKE